MEINLNYKREIAKELKEKLDDLINNVINIYDDTDDLICSLQYNYVYFNDSGEDQICLEFQNNDSNIGIYGIIEKTSTPSYFKIPANNYDDYIIKGNVSEIPYSGDLQFSNIDWVKGELNVLNYMRICI